MRRAWSQPLPLAMVCPDCQGELPRGTQLHACGVETLSGAEFMARRQMLHDSTPKAAA